MKLKNSLKVLTFVFAGTLIFTSCVKEGPMGLAGADGTNGTNGTSGKDGATGTATCLVCHNTTTKNAVTAQYKTSQHAAGSATARSVDKGCAPCHSNEGFIEVLQTKKDTTRVGVAFPTNVSCSTCHATHETFDFTKDGQDYALRTTAAVDLKLYVDPTKVVDFKNTSNLCVNCHQPRESYKVPGQLGETTYAVTSSRFGPHHGPQGTLVDGQGGMEIPGPTAYPTAKSAHRAGACVSCHMGPYSASQGGHTWHASLPSCKTCHTSATTFDVGGKQTEVVALVAELKAALTAKGILDAAGAITKPGGKNLAVTNPLNLPVLQAGALWNYFSIIEDRSNGVHNPGYIKALLKNSIATLK